MRWA